VAILLWLKQAAAGGILPMPLDTRWITWVILATVAAWLVITHNLRVQIRKEKEEGAPIEPVDIDCERFPDQCPCTTELGKGVA